MLFHATLLVKTMLSGSGIVAVATASMVLNLRIQGPDRNGNEIMSLLADRNCDT